MNKYIDKKAKPCDFPIGERINDYDLNDLVHTLYNRYCCCFWEWYLLSFIVGLFSHQFCNAYLFIFFIFLMGVLVVKDNKWQSTLKFTLQSIEKYCDGKHYEKTKGYLRALKLCSNERTMLACISLVMVLFFSFCKLRHVFNLS